MPGAVYILCALTSLACSILLFRGYRRTGVRLLFWSGLCFTGLALDNVLLYIDLIVVPSTDLTIYRRLPGLVALGLLVFGLIWDGS
jgi:hypothetical protein